MIHGQALVGLPGGLGPSSPGVARPRDRFQRTEKGRENAPDTGHTRKHTFTRRSRSASPAGSREDSGTRSGDQKGTSPPMTRLITRNTRSTQHEGHYQISDQNCSELSRPRKVRKGRETATDPRGQSRRGGVCSVAQEGPWDWRTLVGNPNKVWSRLNSCFSLIVLKTRSMWLTTVGKEGSPDP